MTQDLGGDSFDSSVDDLEPLSSLEVLETNTVLTKAQAWSLYTSHFLSTWNMRMYEFAAVRRRQIAPSYFANVHRSFSLQLHSLTPS